MEVINRGLVARKLALSNVTFVPSEVAPLMSVACHDPAVLDHLTNLLTVKLACSAVTTGL